LSENMLTDLSVLCDGVHKVPAKDAFKKKWKEIYFWVNHKKANNHKKQWGLKCRQRKQKKCFWKTSNSYK
jgi:hypothetical protein